MGPLKLSVLVCVVFFLTLNVDAQHILSRTAYQTTCLIPYRTAGDKSYTYGNAILRELAKDVLREPWLVRIRFSCELGLTISGEGDHAQLGISLRRLVVKGDTVYRHFPVADILYPALISMKLRWANRADTSGFTEELIYGKPLPRSDSLICMVPVSSYDPKVDTLLVREVECFYDSLSVRAFLDRVALIHDYYAAVSLLDSLQQFTSDINPGDTKMLPYDYLRIEELCRVTGRISARDFPGKLLRNGYDPRGLIQKHTQIYKYSRTLIFNFIDAVHKTNLVPWEKDILPLSHYFTLRIYSYVRRSFLMDQLQGSIYNDFLDHCFDQPDFLPEENIANDLIAKMFPLAARDTIARYITERIYESYRGFAKQLMEQSRYAEAFAMMDNGRRFIAGNPSLNRIKPDELLQSQAAAGICNSYIGIAKSCIGAHKYDMAETYLSKADQYVTAHSQYFQSDSSLRAAFGELFFLRNVECDQLLGQKRYTEALDCYRQFETTYSAHDLALLRSQLDEKMSEARMGLGRQTALLTEDALKHNSADTALLYYEKAKALRQEGNAHEPVDTRLDSLAPVMARIKYQQIFREASLALEKRQFTLAVARFTEAKSLAGTFKIEHSSDFDSLYKRAVKNLLIVQLSASQKKIWANQFDSAQVALQKTRNAGFDYGLLNDPDFSAALENYKLKIRDQRCRNLRDSVDFRMIRADRGAALKNFINASRFYGEAFNLAVSDTACLFDSGTLSDSMEKYREPREYQMNGNTIHAMVAVGNYADALNTLERNQLLFKSARLELFGLEPVDLYEFIAAKNNPYLTEAAATLNLNKKLFPAAFRFLLLLKEQHMDAKQVKPLQEKLGTAMARADFVSKPDENTVAVFQKYQLEVEWFHAFWTAYKNESERQKKSLNGDVK